jgi:hypothetical protein
MHRPIHTLAARLAFALIGAIALAAGFAGLGQRPASAQIATAEGGGLALVELYTAQGCDTCRSANLSLAALADHPELIVLTFPVSHWDYLGWRDTFARPEFADRQRAYASALGVRGLTTPQIVINGARAESGAASTRVRELIAATPGARRAPLQLRVAAPGIVEINLGVGPRRPIAADIWLALFEPRPAAVTPVRGENAGAPVLQRNVVRELHLVGAWSGRPFRLETACAPACAVIVQERGGGAVLAAAQSAKR